MKLHSLCILLGASLWASSAFAQLPAASSVHHSISIDAKTVASGGSGSNKMNGGLASSAGPSTSTASSAQNQNHQATLEITLRNFGKDPDTVKVEWYFVATPIAANSHRHDCVFDQGFQDQALKPGETVTFTAQSKVLQSSIVRSVTQTVTGNAGLGNQQISTSSSVNQTGSKIKGWFVRAIADGQVLLTRGSDFNYEDIAKDDAKIKALSSAPK